DRVLACVSGLVTVTLRVPTVALALMVMFAVSCVAELNVHELTVIPAPKLHVAPLWKLLPVRMKIGRVSSRAPVLGLTEVGGVGGGGAVTVKALVRVLACVSGLVTVTLREPTVALALMAMLAVSCVAELNVQELTVIPAPKLHVAPLWKLLPVRM